MPVAVHESGTTVLLGPGPIPTVAPVAIPTPGAISVPTTAPTPAAVTPPTSGTAPIDTGLDIPDNDAPVARVGAKVAFVECNGGQIVPDSAYATSAAVGCRVHFDATAKDASGKDTRARHTPEWSFTNNSIIRVKDSGSGGYTPVMTGLAPGSVSIFATIDGVSSGTMHFEFQ